MSYGDYLASDRRLVMLRILKGAPGHSLNCRSMQKVLIGAGHRVSLDRVRTEAAWLEEQGVIKTEPFEAAAAKGYMILTLTQRGTDVANGHTEVPGIDVPSGD
ncbi:ArsR family transcriptional regulator [Kordiimonas marina]|uniref:VpaChn25_0724 family phage protein n=1 Tax=Kordiimonas marina TaxID=2872312 RepID=UPI001FF3807B|nr:ArsR family transcriptional regulator [Kordiimonas marina]MCJ9428558.1 ArsR family transcriptional regulator [Kordiimonas marina]